MFRFASSDCHYFPDDIRSNFISANGVSEELVDKVGNPNSLWRADQVRELFDHGIAFSILHLLALTILQTIFELRSFRPTSASRG